MDEIGEVKLFTLIFLEGPAEVLQGLRTVGYKYKKTFQA